MKLLFDQNLSPKLVNQLSDLFPNSIHVQDAGLDTAEDTEVWDYAQAKGYLVVSKDADFGEKSAIHGHSPKVIWLKRGNCPTSTVEGILRNHYSDIQTFVKDVNQGLLVLL